VWQVLRCACGCLQVLRFGRVRWVSLWVSVCLWVSALSVCAVPVVRPAALSVCCVAGFALCGAVGVCAVVCAYALCYGGRVWFYQ